MNMAKRRLWLWTLLLLTLLLAACQDGAVSGALIWEGQHTYERGQIVQGHLVLLDGAVIIAEGAQVSGSIYMLGGDLQLNGAVAGDVAMLAGDLVLSPSTHVAGDLSIGGGTASRAPQATIDGAVRGAADAQLNLESLFPRLTIRQRLLRLLPESLIVAILAYVAARFLNRPLERVRRAAVHHPVISAAMGALLVLVVPALLVLMAFTVILIPLTVVAILLVGAVVVYAWIALGMAVGLWLRDRLQASWTPALTAFLGTALFMVATNLLALIPIAGGWAGLLATAIGTGAIFLTRFGLRDFVPTYDFAPPAGPH